MPSADVAAFGCGDEAQALIWLLRKDSIRGDGTLDPLARPLIVEVGVPGLRAGTYRVVPWSSSSGPAGEAFSVTHAAGEMLRFATPGITTDIAFALQAE